MSDVLERVRKLIALTASSNEGEARNAAEKACQLIRDHKLVVGHAEPENIRFSFRTKDTEVEVDLGTHFRGSGGGGVTHISSDGRYALCGLRMTHGIPYVDRTRARNARIRRLNKMCAVCSEIM